MTAARFRSLGVVLLAIVCAAVLGVTSMLASAFMFAAEKVIAQIKLLADEGWIMGGTANPLPTQDYIDQVLGLYLQPSPPLFPGQPTFPGFNFQGLSTPEQFCPIVCVGMPPGLPADWNGLNFGDSLNVGVTQLDNAITPQIGAGDNVAVLGYSQSATVATMEMQDLVKNGVTDPNLHFVLLGDANNPIGGILTRFEFPPGIGPFFSTIEQHVPFVNIPLGIGATPTEPFPTDIYTGEYDGWANFPEDPGNILADINALIGTQTVHPYYPIPTPDVNLDTNDIIDLGTIGNTHFYDIFAPIPMLAFMYDGGAPGRFFYDFFAPATALSFNWSYGNPGDPGAGIPVDGVDPIGAAGPWAITATGQLANVSDDVAGFIPRMDPLQMLAGMEWAGVQTFIGPLNDFLNDVGAQPLPQSVIDGLLSGYTFTNEVDQSLLTGWNDLATSLNLQDILGPDAIFNGAPLISGAPLIGVVGLGFDIFNLFGA